MIRVIDQLWKPKNAKSEVLHSMGKYMLYIYGSQEVKNMVQGGEELDDMQTC